MTGARPLSSPDSGSGIYDNSDPDEGVVPSLTLLNRLSYSPSNPALDRLVQIREHTSCARFAALALAPYSSRRYKPLEISEENTRGSIVPATRQLFDVRDLAAATEDEADQSALLIRDASGLRMAIVKGPLTEQYETTSGEEERPVTPGLAEMLKTISESRLSIDNDTREEYQELFKTHFELLIDDRMTPVPAARNIRLDDVINVGTHIVVIVVPPDSDTKLGTRAVTNCMVCAGRSPSRLLPGHTVLAMVHYGGIDCETGLNIRPRGILQKFVDKILAAGGDRDQLEILLAGGEYAAFENDDAHRLEEEWEFLDAKDTFPIVAARIQATFVDTNSSRKTIMRHTDDDNNSGITAVLSKTSFMYSHGKLYDTNG